MHDQRSVENLIENYLDPAREQMEARNLPGRNILIRVTRNNYCPMCKRQADDGQNLSDFWKQDAAFHERTNAADESATVVSLAKGQIPGVSPLFKRLAQAWATRHRVTLHYATTIEPIVPPREYTPEMETEVAVIPRRNNTTPRKQPARKTKSVETTPKTPASPSRDEMIYEYIQLLKQQASAPSSPEKAMTREAAIVYQSHSWTEPFVEAIKSARIVTMWISGALFCIALVWCGLVFARPQFAEDTQRLVETIVGPLRRNMTEL